jgi:ribosomal RNA-processing protein 7
MESYDSNEMMRDDEEKQLLNEPDDEGWIEVSKKSRKGNAPLTERNIAKLNFKQKKKMEKMQLVNFYSFQMKDSKKACNYEISF